MILLKQKSDNIGALASTLCLIHCIATPFLFIVQSCSVTCCSATPVWWRYIDFLFLIVSFFAIYKSTQTTSKDWIKPFMWLSWSILFFLIINETKGWLTLNEKLIYIPALTLITLHLYNKKYCKCETTKCCANN